MVCKTCNTENLSTAKYCNNCGEKLELQGKTCPNQDCKRSGLPDEAVFCPDCGTQMSVTPDCNTSYDETSYDQQLQKFQRIDNIMSEDKEQFDFRKPFLMAIQDIFVIDRRGTAVTGIIENGGLKKGDRIQVVGFNAVNQILKCAGIVGKGNEFVKEGRIGDDVGVLFNEFDLNLRRGQVIAKPDSTFQKHEFISDTYFLATSQGGITEPIPDGFRLQFWFRTVEVNGDIQLPDNEVSIKPDSVIRLRINLANPIAMEVGLRFAIRDNQRTIGAGKILKVL